MDNAIVRSLLVPVRGIKLLMPSAVVAEVTSLQVFEAIPKNPYDWLDGVIHWRSQKIPLLSIEKVLALSPSSNKAMNKQRVIVLYGLEIGQIIPFYALLASDIPRTLILTEKSLTDVDIGERHSGIVFLAKVGGENIWIPDLNYFEQLLKESSAALH